MRPGTEIALHLIERSRHLVVHAEGNRTQGLYVPVSLLRLDFSVKMFAFFDFL
jgi:hypothetical protein